MTKTKYVDFMKTERVGVFSVEKKVEIGAKVNCFFFTEKIQSIVKNYESDRLQMASRAGIFA